MSNKFGGRSTQKGMNFQNWTAMSLLLQYVTREDFAYIGFEGKNLEDFHLVFTDGRKIICESKAKKINFVDIRKILDNIFKHGQMTDQDEILIVCEKVNREAKNLIENFKYYGEDLKKKLKSRQHKFEDKHLKLLPRLRFWEINQVITDKTIQLLMAKVLSYPDSFWVPEKRLEEITKSIIENKVYRGSQKGDILTRVDFLNLLKSKKIEILEDDGYEYEKVKQIQEKEIRGIIKSIKLKKGHLNINNEITRLYANPSIHHFALQKLVAEKNLKISDWGNLWLATYQSAFSFELFNIFENNLQDRINQEFILDFIFRIIGGATNYFREEFIKYDTVKLCRKVLNLNRSLEEKIFSVIKKLFQHSISKFLYLQKRNDDAWEREETAKLLEELYTKSQNKQLKEDIVDYLINNFNVIKDDGKFWHYTPPSIFQILSEQVSGNPEKLIPWFTQKCIEQYKKFYLRLGKNLGFKGWEHMGGGISQSGSEFSIIDGHFVTQIITPALQKLYEQGKENAWKFILENCIARKISQVSVKKPDFLNRASIPIIFQEYKNGKHKQGAFGILNDFIKMRQGIPWKADLIFQELKGDYSNNQKWDLVKASLGEYENLPVNVFVEQIVFDLVSKSHPKASDLISDWVKNPEYNARHMIGDYGPTEGIIKLVENNFDKAVITLKAYISTIDFQEKLDTFDVYDLANALSKILEKKFQQGLSILKEVNQAKVLTTNQQILICSSLYKTGENQPEIIKRTFDEFVKPLVVSIHKYLEKRFTNRHAREQIVQFAEKLAKAGFKKDALWLVEIFIKDSDPPRDGSNYPEDKKGEFNQHARIAHGEDESAIGTVRGYCAWVLQKLVIPFNPADQKITRQLLPECIKLVEQLCFDPNFYVRTEGCIPLIELVKNRHTHIPGDSKVRFMSEILAQKVELIAFKMLQDKNNPKLKQVMRHLAIVFSYMRTLGTNRAKFVLQTFLKSKSEDVIDQTLPLLIFYALFRKTAFPYWPWKKLESFTQKVFEKMLDQQLTNGRPEVKAKLAWHFERLPDEIKKTPVDKSSLTVSQAVGLSAKYLLKLTAKYDHQVFDDLYRFVEENLDDYFKVSFKLWCKGIKTESKYFHDHWSEDKLSEMYWWPFFYNGKVLLAILKNKGIEEFIDWFKILANYPEKVLIANDLDVAVEALTQITDQKYKKNITNLFKLLIMRNPKYYDYKQKWLLNFKGKKQ